MVPCEKKRENGFCASSLSRYGSDNNIWQKKPRVQGIETNVAQQRQRVEVDLGYNHTKPNGSDTKNILESMWSHFELRGVWEKGISEIDDVY